MKHRGSSWNPTCLPAELQKTVVHKTPMFGFLTRQLLEASTYIRETTGPVTYFGGVMVPAWGMPCSGHVHGCSGFPVKSPILSTTIDSNMLRVLPLPSST